MTSKLYDLVIKNGTYFDGSKQQPYQADVAIKNGKIIAVEREGIAADLADKLIEAKDHWVMPGFIEIHSHYDAEVIAAPALQESVRHGVTSVAVGSCSISMINAEAEDCSDLFTRVEAVPREKVLPILKQKKTWQDAKGYREFYQQHPLGPNLFSFIGHSDIRVAAMGIERATSDIKPSENEMQAMEQMLEQALDNGCVGMSMMTTKLDKLDGDRAWSKPLPSTFASWWEFKRLFKILRRRNGILQGAPDAVKKVNIFGFFWQAHGLFRRPMKITMLTAMDLKSNPLLTYITRGSGFVVNKLLRGNYRWQTLPAPFTIYLEGLRVNAFEEFDSGALLRDIKDDEALYQKINEPNFRQAFRKEVSEILTVGLWHRNLSDGWIIDCPDINLIGKNFQQVGETYGVDAVDAYFDLASKYREKLRWKTSYGNHRPEKLYPILKSPSTHIGFADSGAHVRQLAMYNFPLRMLKYIRDAEQAGRPFMSYAEGVHKLTGDLADWFGLKIGSIKVGKQADIAIINPVGLNQQLDEISEAPMQGFDMQRLVKRNDDAVKATIINGKIAYQKDQLFDPELGKTTDFGQYLTSYWVESSQSKSKQVKVS